MEASISIDRITLNHETLYLMYDSNDIQNGILLIGKFDRDINCIVPFRCSNTFKIKNNVLVTKEFEEDFREIYKVELSEFFNIIY